VLEGIDGIVRGARHDPRTLFAIGIGASGPARSDVPWNALLEARFRAPVQIDSGANMAARGERWLGVARDVDDFVFVVLGLDVGAGVVIGGRVHHGHRWSAGGIGRMTLDYRDWEADQGPEGYFGSRLGKPDDDVAAVVGSAVANIAAILDPGLVVLGGRLPSEPAAFVDRVRTVVSRIVPNVPLLEVSALGEDTQLLGAVSAAMELADTQLLALAASPGGLTDAGRRPVTRR
jgi:predicted NBD/HSP70 family sugar kinase